MKKVIDEGVTVDYAKTAKGSATKYADPIHGAGSYRSHSSHKTHHMAALKKAGASDDHAAAIHKHASTNDDDHKKSNKPGYDYMSKQGKFTVHSKNVRIGDGGGDKIKYQVESTNNKMKRFKDIRESLEERKVDESDYPEVRKHLKKTGKGGSVSYTDNDGKTKKSGKYGGLMNRGGRSYAKVHHDDNTMGLVPLPNVHHK